MVISLYFVDKNRVVVVGVNMLDISICWIFCQGCRVDGRLLF